jgi:hypothetical protein
LTLERGLLAFEKSNFTRRPDNVCSWRAVRPQNCGSGDLACEVPRPRTAMYSNLLAIEYF